MGLQLAEARVSASAVACAHAQGYYRIRSLCPFHHYESYDNCRAVRSVPVGSEGEKPCSEGGRSDGSAGFASCKDRAIIPSSFSDVSSDTLLRWSEAYSAMALDAERMGIPHSAIPVLPKELSVDALTR